MIPFAIPALLRAHWKLIAVGGAILILSLYAWRVDSLRASYKAERDDVRAEYALFRKEVVARAADALAAQKKVNADQEREWKDRADDADKSIDDLRARLRTALVRSKADRSAGGGASATAKVDDTGVSAGVPTPAPGDPRSVQVDADILAGLAAYAIQARDWALSLDKVE